MPTVANLARRLNCHHPAGRGLPALILMTDEQRLPDPVAATKRLPPGSMVIFRHYDAPERETLAQALLWVCRPRRLPLLIAGDWRLALRIGADGVHLPEAMVAGMTWIKPRRGWIVTASAHSEAALRRACRTGADAILLAPVFATLSHPGTPSLGPQRFARLVRASDRPVYALGGISDRTAPRLQGTGAVGIAAIGALVPAEPSSPAKGSVRHRR